MLIHCASQTNYCYISSRFPPGSGQQSIPPTQLPPSASPNLPPSHLPPQGPPSSQLPPKPIPSTQLPPGVARPPQIPPSSQSPFQGSPDGQFSTQGASGFNSGPPGVKAGPNPPLTGVQSASGANLPPSEGLGSNLPPQGPPQSQIPPQNISQGQSAPLGPNSNQFPGQIPLNSLQNQSVPKSTASTGGPTNVLNGGGPGLPPASSAG